VGDGAPVAWLFPGQGSQKVGMGRSLAAADPTAVTFFRDADRAARFPMTQTIASGPERILAQTPVQQPAIVATSIAMLRALTALDRLPPAAYVAGHSLGEYSALVAAGALDPFDAIRLVRCRGELMQEHGAGAMAAVIGLPAAAVAEAAAAAGAEVANFNAPDQTTVAGLAEAVERAMALAKKRGARRTVLLPVSAAFHSSMMAPVVDGLRPLLEATPIAPARMPVVANLDARLLTHPDDLRQELLDEICAPVQWVNVIQVLGSAGVREAYEIGPGKVLAGLVARCDKNMRVTTAESLLAACGATVVPG
jgi:[acyl-carrier-protein] S-malonyltransferase